MNLDVVFGMLVGAVVFLFFLSFLDVISSAWKAHKAPYRHTPSSICNFNDGDLVVLVPVDTLLDDVSRVVYGRLLTLLGPSPYSVLGIIEDISVYSRCDDGPRLLLCNQEGDRFVVPSRWFTLPEEDRDK